MHLIVVPAYSKDYSTGEEAIAGFLAGRDWKIMDISCRYNGGYMSIHDVPKLVQDGCTGLKLRFKRWRRWVVLDFEVTESKVIITHNGSLITRI